MKNELPQIESSRQYEAKIRKLEIKMFPEFKKDVVYGSENTVYVYFAPSWYFWKGLITETDIKDFLKDNTKKLLSVGSGAAYLEKLLVRLGIKKDNITLADIDPENLPVDFKSKTFDMWEKWPELEDGMYDLIIFPESILINLKFENDEQTRMGIYNLIFQALQYLSPSGTIRMTIQLDDDWNTRALENMFRQESREIKIILRNNLMEVKIKKS